jgi:signal transduction histidine kinase
MSLLPESSSAAPIAEDAVRRLPWYRRFSQRLGLQGKLVICFILLLGMSLGTACWVLTRLGRANLADLMGEQARQLSSALALASQQPMADRRRVELAHVGQDLIKSRNILFVVFLDQDFQPIAHASRDPDFDAATIRSHISDTRELMQVQTHSSPVLGSYIEVVAPVFSRTTISQASMAPRAMPGTRLVGYVAVGLSQAYEQAQIRKIHIMAAGIGSVAILIAVPLAYMLVYRIFLPIRELVQATNQIAAGDLETRVAIDRPDVIGTLARAFNEMVLRVKRQQDELEEANHDLEKKVLQRTAQLESANKRLSAEIAEKEDFLRAVSHDLNAPLRNISGMATMLLMKHREKFDEDVVHRLERIQKNVEIETDLIAELLELSRIKTRRQKMEHVETSAIVRELGDVFENDLRTRGIALVLDNELPVLHCERARIRQVFQNLIDNAIKYMGDGPVREIHVGSQIRMDEVEFYVRDTGIGIDREDLDKVFFVFRRGKNTQVTNVNGKGVGLASVKSIIETYNGSIWIESEVGKGSTFRFTINGSYVPAAASYAARPALSESGAERQ